MINIVCPRCKEELYLKSAIQTEEEKDDELIIVLEKALCKNCKKVFDIQFEVANIVEIGDEEDFYLDEEEKEDDEEYGEDDLPW